jgi:phosphatidylethanolamine-binding protein (PEBP) family uncharacterized protein
VHWAIWGLSASTTSIGDGDIPAEATQGSGFMQLPDEWFGSGNCDNVYELSVFALASEPTASEPGALRDELEANTNEIVLARDYARVTPKAPCGN